MAKLNRIESLFKAHYVQLYRLAIALLHDEEVARDVVHDVFEALLHSGQREGIGTAYLVQAVRNRCLNHLRNCDRRARIEHIYFLDTAEYDAEDWPDEDTLALINSIVESDISPQARQAIRLRFADGLPFAEIAKTMQISENAVYRHVRKALVIIRQNLRTNG